MIIERIPHFSDQQIINQFHNALDEIQKNGPRSAEAVLVIEAIQIEWQKRYAEISRGERKGALPKTGVLGVLGYHVGKEATALAKRRQIIDFVITGHLPLVLSPAHMAEWGQPNSLVRYEKLRRSLFTFRQKLRKDSNTEKAENEYTLDLDYLKSRWGKV